MWGVLYLQEWEAFPFVASGQQQTILEVHITHRYTHTHTLSHTCSDVSNPTPVLSCWWRSLICTRQRFWQRKLMFTFLPSPFQNCSLLPHFCLFGIRRKKLAGKGGRNFPKYNLNQFKSKCSKRHMVLPYLFVKNCVTLCTPLSPHYCQNPPQTRRSTGDI